MITEDTSEMNKNVVSKNPPSENQEQGRRRPN